MNLGCLASLAGHFFQNLPAPFSYLRRVQTGVEPPQTRIQNMQVPQFDTPVIFLAEDMRPHRRDMRPFIVRDSLVLLVAVGGPMAGIYIFKSLRKPK